MTCATVADVTDQTSSTAQPQEKEPRAIATASSGAFNGAAHDGTAVPNDIQWATLAGHERLLLGGVPTLSMREMAERAGTSLALARRFWRAMGFADVEPDEVRFTDNDVDALRTTLNDCAAGGDGAPSALERVTGTARSTTEVLRSSPLYRLVSIIGIALVGAGLVARSKRALAASRRTGRRRRNHNRRR